jgi:DNA ligase-1
MLASDAIEDKLLFPVILQPKIDGVRGLNMGTGLTGRSLKRHKNRYTTDLYSHPSLVGLDGELAAERDTHPDLCRLTSSALGTIKGEPYTLWWLFDYVMLGGSQELYSVRYKALEARVRYLRETTHPLACFLRVVPSVLCTSLAQLLEQETVWLNMGYEGVIIRDPNGVHKSGRSTPKEGGLLRIKRFIEEDAVVEQIIEGDSNENEAQINERGLQFRSSHQENKIPNGMVGSLICKDVKSGKEMTVAAGKMTHEERLLFFADQKLLIGKTIKYKHFPKGVKDKPRFPTFQSLRADSDI